MPFDAMRNPETVYSVCPHDCPSTCALAVERLSPGRIGRVYGARGHPYTDGIVCAKVARYAERIHHPDRLTQPLRRVGEKGREVEIFESLDRDEALDEVADAFILAEEAYSAETDWPCFYAGTMGHVQRDGIKRRGAAIKCKALLDVPFYPTISRAK